MKVISSPILIFLQNFNLTLESFDLLSNLRKIDWLELELRVEIVKIILFKVKSLSAVFEPLRSWDTLVLLCFVLCFSGFTISEIEVSEESGSVRFILPGLRVLCLHEWFFWVLGRHESLTKVIFVSRSRHFLFFLHLWSWYPLCWNRPIRSYLKRKI